MAITYHAGRRIQGLSTDVAIINRGTITTDGSYTVIKFTENGKFTPTSSFNVEYLVVGGGGAGGAGANNSGAGAGGGAGGYRTATGHAVTAQDYNIIVGTGGTGRSTYGQGEDGGDSTFDNITSIGGGGGGYLTAGGTGGSGGGSGNNGTAGASGTAGQGNSGGAGQYRSGGGGGGAGSAGSSSTNSNGGAGGNGISSSITGSSVIYSAGGGGGADNVGGAGGSSNTGGRGVPNGTAQAGTGVANTGSGGGGTYVTTSYPSGSGADGVVILRFLTSGNTYDTSSGKPTNVQVGSRFEETDTRKMYNLKEQPTPESTATYQVTDTSGTQTLYQNFSQAYISAQKVGSGSVLVGKRVSKLELHLYRVGSPTGTATVGVWNGSGELQYTFGTIDVSTITTATNATLYTFNNTDSTHVFSANEYFGISYNTGGDGSNKIAVYHDDASPPFDGTNSVWSRYNGSSWTDFTAVDNSFKLYLATEGGTMVWQEIGA